LLRRSDTIDKDEERKLVKFHRKNSAMKRILKIKLLEYSKPYVSEDKRETYKRNEETEKHFLSSKESLRC